MSLALIAGSGRLPELLIARAEAPQVFALEDQAPALPVPVQTFRLETFGTLIARMVETGVTELCLAGAIYRPAIDPTRIDPATAPLMPRLAAAIGKGDAGALGVVTDLFEEAGLHIVGAHHLRPDLLPAAGVPTRTQPAGPPRGRRGPGGRCRGGAGGGGCRAGLRRGAAAGSGGRGAARAPTGCWPACVTARPGCPRVGCCSRRRNRGRTGA